MIKLIIKNLWSRRRRNGWLLAELVLVCIVSWIIFDPVAVVVHDRRIPLGYDADRLCIVYFNMLQPGTPGYDSAASDSAQLMDSYLGLLQRLHQHPDIEHATALLGWLYPNSSGWGERSMTAEGDSMGVSYNYVEFLPHTDFFETYGFRSSEGPSPEALSDYPYRENDMVVTEDLLQLAFGDSRLSGKRFIDEWNGSDTTWVNLIGTVRPFKLHSNWQPLPVAFVPQVHVDVARYFPHFVQMLVRLREDVSVEHFLHDFHPWMIQHLRAGNLYANKVETYNDMLATSEYSTTTALVRRNASMAVFFLVNLCLGVAGTFWLQTRSRREEVGILLTFGGTPRLVRLMLMGEGFILTTLATAVGCFLYLQYALSEGLARGFTNGDVAQTYWVTDFRLHFLLVSALVYGVLLAVVLIGVYLPARSISRVPPTEALRDE